ncbi:hypothetical protein TRFO_04433 [Tritrichomonas foetus]|uniref:Uncharacterized protein n=1 Tax=Tritrichomonas foetus TaxID=1144522 RepID=A0A1J4KG26_9EUKA|nr:hypothetical protein TRFO_04433 [Tritrichomonas foetus]|eukprot:OHT09888.1 hypothetical protein TRFO_04433 [Tritrichomonas foetus]
MNVSNLLVENNQNEDARREDRMNVKTINYALQKQIEESKQIINNFSQNGTITQNDINLIGDTLSKMNEPEKYGLNVFLLNLIDKNVNQEITNASISLLKRNFNGDCEIALPSFNVSSFANDNCFNILLHLLSGPKDLQILAIVLISCVFENISDRDFISASIYEQLFQFLSNTDFYQIFLSLILKANDIPDQFHEAILSIINMYLSQESDNLAQYGLFSLAQILQFGVDVEQDVIISCIQRFINSYDESTTLSLLCIMRFLENPPQFVFERLIVLTTLEDHSLCFSSLRLLANFGLQWNDEQKQVLTSHLLKEYSKFEYNSKLWAIRIIVLVANPLPTDIKFFADLIAMIDDCDFKSLAIRSAFTIINSWNSVKLTSEQQNLVNDFIVVLNNSINSEDTYLAELCQAILSTIENEILIDM